jgi:DNA polymerase III delta prime subunit
MDIIPWVEKYRPNQFNDIILDSTNKTILLNIINQNNFPNLLLYGQPGTGKTTTIINLIKEYQRKNNEEFKELIIHLNASDDRGIDIIRNQINSFSNSSIMFRKGMKFIVLDEIDYMTKNAQLALKYLIQQNNHSIRYCLICNYISKIDKTLQNEFLKLKFNQLPKEHIYNFLHNIIQKENLDFSKETCYQIIDLYKSDIRSMINDMQNISCLNKWDILTPTDIEIFITNIKTTKNNKNNKNKMINKYLNKFNMEKYQFIVYIFNYLVKKNPKKELLDFIEEILHTNNYNTLTFDEYFINELSRISKI